MLSWDELSDTAFDAEVLESLLHMEEGPTLDFKREQYRFNRASDEDKSELLKDILAFANSQRYSTAYILVGVEEVKGGRSEVVGVQEQLDDASLHQFVNFKTNRPVAFTYFPFGYEGREIGVLSIALQTRPVYSLRKYGIVQANTVYVRDGSSTRIANPDEIAEMGRGDLRLVEWSVQNLTRLAKHAVVETVGEWQRHPGRHHEHGLFQHDPDYSQAREWVLYMVDLLPLPAFSYPEEMDSYRVLYPMFKRFERLADFCSETIDTVGSALIGSAALLRAISEMKKRISQEKSVWDEFRTRMAGPKCTVLRTFRWEVAL